MSEQTEGGQGVLLAFEEHQPQVGEDVFIAPTASVVGRVRLGARSSVWYATVLRADEEVIAIGAECNVQDGCVLHSDPGEPTELGDRVSLGHGAIVHAAIIEPDVLVGMRAVVLNGARVGAGSVVAAGAVVLPGTEVPPGSLVAGVPAKVRRDAGEVEAEMIRSTAQEYVELAARHRRTIRPVPRHG